MKKILAAALLGALAIGPASAQNDAPKKSGAPVRKMLQQTEVPGSNYITIMSTTTLQANFTVDRHTHPGTEMSYILDGEGDLYINDKLVQHLVPGSTDTVPANTPHYVVTGPKPMKIIVVYVIPKDAPISSPAPKNP